MFQTRQPLNNIAPFYVGAFSVDMYGNVIAETVTFPDGSTMSSAGNPSAPYLPSDIDVGTF